MLGLAQLPYDGDAELADVRAAEIVLACELIGLSTQNVAEALALRAAQWLSEAGQHGSLALIPTGRLLAMRAQEVRLAHLVRLGHGEPGTVAAFRSRLDYLRAMLGRGEPVDG